mmetsp:Transcript_49613/g.116545  ORF Transcript_49613/g.116545 Transcript_49613/m.116545 type:complete len:214 (-) Transcript_49613:187-828(-)
MGRLTQGERKHRPGTWLAMIARILAGPFRPPGAPRHALFHQDPDQRHQEQRPQGDAAAHQDPRDLPARPAAPHDGRGCLQGPARRGRRHRPGHGLPRAAAVRAGRPAQPQPFRDRQGGVRAQRGPPPRPPGLPDLRQGRGVLRRRHRGAPARDRARAGLPAAGTFAGLVRQLHQDRLPEPRLIRRLPVRARWPAGAPRRGPRPSRPWGRPSCR